MKKALSVILCLCTVFTLFGVSGYAEEAPFYSLTFNADGGVFDNGEETKVFYLHEGDAVSDILPPSRNAYDFKGWNKALPEKMPANNLTFSAVWEAIPGADPEDGKIPIEKVELNIYINRVYADVPVISCLIEGSVPKNSVYSFSETLQKNINGKWTENFVKDNFDEEIGAGKYRWKVKFDVEWNYSEKYKTAPDVTKAYIDGKSYGTLDSDCAVYTNPFEITEKDKRPETVVIKELRVDGFKAPTVGEKPQSDDELIIPDNSGYECSVFWGEVTSDGSFNYTLWEDDSFYFSDNSICVCLLDFYPVNEYYSISVYAKTLINGKTHYFTDTAVTSVNGYSVGLRFNVSKYSGPFSFLNSIILYLRIYFNLLFSIFKKIST